MHMFCYQCQETSEGRGCTFGGHCGKSEEVANYQDLLIYTLKGLGEVAVESIEQRAVELDCRRLGLRVVVHDDYQHELRSRAHHRDD